MAIKNQVIVRFRNYKCTVKYAEYANGRTAIQLVDVDNHELVATVTINLPGVPLDDDEVIIKNYSENEGMTKAMIRAGLISEPVRFTESGYVTNIPICKLLVQ